MEADDDGQAERSGEEPPSPEAETTETVVAVVATSRRIALTRFRERLRNSLLVMPTLAILGAFAVAEMLIEVDRFVDANVDANVEVAFAATAAAVQNVTTAVATAMLTFMGVVFSLTILALQMASSQFSPRVMRTFVRSRVTKLTMATFMATFSYALSLLANIEPGNEEVDAFLPALSYLTLLTLVFVSLIVFVVYVNNIVRLVRVGHIIEAIARETRRAVTETLQAPRRRRDVTAPRLGMPAFTIIATDSGVLGSVNVRALARAGDRHEVTLVLRVRAGEYVGKGQPLVDVHGAGRPNAWKVNRAIYLDTERTMLDDPAFGIRQIADIAIRALSPGVNDPTTAVQALDRITDLLTVIGSAPDQSPYYAWRGDTVRVVWPVHDWASTVELAFTEVRHYGHEAPQIGRRLEASIETLLEVLDPSRHPPLLRQKELLERAVCSDVDDDADRTFLLTPDRGGIG
ncbi:MAG: DUF2254 domain-containing protein [Acidimicrobiia bacterium]|nr:DUF2254 domain-containing protein [Acidimicrobiia bacterium]